MPPTDVAPIEISTEIAVPPAKVWSLISDPRNYPRWSPQTWKTIVRGGEVKPGATMFNVNKRRFMVWPTQAKIEVVDPEKKFAFRVKENWTTWSFELEPTAAGGTLLTQRREAPEGISGLSLRVTKIAFGGVEPFTEELEQGMTQTLAKVKAEAER